MSDQAQQLMRFAIDAYAEYDAALAAALDDIDDLLDRLQVEFIAAIFESHAAGTHRPRGRRAAGAHRPVLRAHR